MIDGFFFLLTYKINHLIIRWFNNLKFVPPGIQRYIKISHTYANNNFLLFTHPFLRVSDWSISKFSETHGGLCWRWSDNLWHQRFHLSWYVKGVTKIRKLFTYRWQTILSFIKNFKNVNKLSSYEFNPVRGIHQILIHTKIIWTSQHR